MTIYSFVHLTRRLPETHSAPPPATCTCGSARHSKPGKVPSPDRLCDVRKQVWAVFNDPVARRFGRQRRGEVGKLDFRHVCAEVSMQRARAGPTSAAALPAWIAANSVNPWTSMARTVEVRAHDTLSCRTGDTANLQPDPQALIGPAVVEVHRSLGCRRPKCESAKRQCDDQGARCREGGRRCCPAFHTASPSSRIATRS